MDHDAPDAEVDLLAIVDGEAIMCEVKSSWRSLRTCHIEDFIALAIKLRPDIAILAVMEEGERHTAQLALAKAELLAMGIKYELLTPKHYKVEGDPYL